MRSFLIFSILFFAFHQAGAQLLPRENSALNYRIIGFSFPFVQEANKYRIEIAAGDYDNTDSFKRNIVYSGYSKTKKLIAEVPFFGRKYTWRIITKDNGSSKSVGEELHHFSTSIIPAVDTSLTRLRVLQKPLKYKDAYIFLDGNRALYDMNGQPVWYLPDIDGYNTDKSLLRDLKITDVGTITFMYEGVNAYEINYNGLVLWKSPNNGKISGLSTESYHHEFTRLASGNYMILGIEPEVWNKQLPSSGDSSYKIHPKEKGNDKVAQGEEVLPFGTVIEYDKNGNIVWFWKSSDYFRNSDLYNFVDHGRPELAAHENSFYFDEHNKAIYVGFRNISRIVKISYPDKRILNIYGERFKPDSAAQGNGLFCRQHSVRRSEEGYLYLYDNNICNRGETPKVIKLREPDNGTGLLQKIWEYQCVIDGISEQPLASYQFPTGGNVQELPDHSLMVNMSTAYSKVFLLSPDKDVLWSAIPERLNTKDKKWAMVYDYRASMITSRAQLENLIWQSEKN